MFGATITLALGAVLASAAPTLPQAAPVRLVSEPSGNGVRLRVVGASAAPYSGRFRLTVASEAGGAGNRSVQSGTANLRPGTEATLVDLTLGRVSDGWSAVLEVTSSDGGSYKQVEPMSSE